MYIKEKMSKALAMAVMLSLFAGQAYAAGQVDVFGEFNPIVDPTSNYGEIRIRASAGENVNIKSSLYNDQLVFRDENAPDSGLRSMAVYAGWGATISAKQADGNYRNIITLTDDGLRMGYNDATDKIKLSYGDGTDSNPGGLELGGRKITGLADGEIAAASKEGVNGGQLYVVDAQTKMNAAEISECWKAIIDSMEDITKNASNIIFLANDIGTNKTNIAANATNITNLTNVVGTLADGNYIRKIDTVAENLLNLDSALGKITADGNYVVKDTTVADNLVRLDGALKTEEVRAKATEAGLQTDIDNEVIRAKAAEAGLQTNIDNEVIRAKAAEAGLQTNIDNEVIRAKAAEAGLQTNIDNEVTRAKAAEQANANAIAAEAVERQNADADLHNKIDDLGSDLNRKFNQTNDRVDRVGATAAALAGIHYQPMVKGQSQVAIGMGGYKGKKATALGVAYQLTDRVSGQVSGSANGSEHMFNVGFNYLFGQHSNKDIAQCAAAPGSMSLKEAELQAKVDSLNNQVGSLHNQIDFLNNKIVELSEALSKVITAK